MHFRRLALLFVALLAIATNAGAEELSKTLQRGSVARAALESAFEPALQMRTVNRVGAWRLQETRNFKIWCRFTAAEAQEVGEACEKVRDHLLRTWVGSNQHPNWMPRCELVLHPTQASYTQALGAGSERSNGCTSIKLDAGRVALRRVDLRADALERLVATVPHELTHVVFADLFPTKQIPRWADEGLALLAEATLRRDSDPIGRDALLFRETVFNARQLLDLQAYPSLERRNAFYGQSASLVRFLVERSGHSRFVTFMQSAQDKGYDAALKSIYGIDGVAQLDRLWSERVRLIVASR